MKDNFNQSDKKIIKLLRQKEGFLLTKEEKGSLKGNLLDKIDKFVTKPDTKRYSLWSYKLNIKGVIMPVMPILLAVLLAGSVGTVALADSAVPGDALFGLDQAMERIEERMPMSQSRRAGFLGKLSEERAEELLALREINQEQFAERAQERWAEHHEEAVERLAISIEKVEAVQTKFQEKLSLAETDEQKAVFQKVIDHLGEVVTKRESKITEMENQEFSGVKGSPVSQQIQEWKQMSPEIREKIHEQIGQMFNGDLQNPGIGKGNGPRLSFGVNDEVEEVDEADEADDETDDETEE